MLADVKQYVLCWMHVWTESLTGCTACTTCWCKPASTAGARKGAPVLCSFYGGNCTAGAGGHTHLPCWSTGTFPASVGPPHPVPMWMGAALVPSLFWGTQVPLKTGQVLQAARVAGSRAGR